MFSTTFVENNVTDALDAAGNTTAARKGLSIGSACLVALALFGAFTTRVSVI
jgi:H+-translocating diphosphatase